MSSAEIASQARRSLAGFTVPDTLVFVSEIPRTAIGKVGKSVLRAMSAERLATADN